MGNNQTLNVIYASQYSDGNSTGCAKWIGIKTENDVIAFWTRLLSSGELGQNKYTLFFHVKINKEDLFPVLQLRVRSSKEQILPKLIVLSITEGNISRVIASCQATPIHSIVHKDYVSPFNFPIGEEDLLKLFQKRCSLSAEFDDAIFPLPIDTDDSLSFIRMKNELVPNRLTEGQKEILLQAQKMEEDKAQEEELRQKREEEEKKRKKDALLLDLSKKLAVELFMGDPYGSHYYWWKSNAYSQRKKLAGLFDAIALKMGLNREEVYNQSSYREIFYRENDIYISFDEVVDILETRFKLGDKEFEPPVSFAGSGSYELTVQDINDVLDGGKSIEQVFGEFYEALSKDDKASLIRDFSKFVVIDILKHNKKSPLYYDVRGFPQFVKERASKESIIGMCKINPDRLSRSRRFFYDIIDYLQELNLVTETNCNLVSYDLSVKQVNDIVDGRITYKDDVAPKFLLRDIIHNAVLSNKELGFGKEYRLNGDLESELGLNVLQEKGIISQLRVISTTYSKEQYYVLYVADYQMACDILDGKQPAQVKKGKGNNTEGCYIATCVYGSYDCPEVWTLRRYRDQVLKNSFLGRLFVRAYYYFSPKLVSRYGEKEDYLRTCRRILDKWVNKLNREGFKNTPYQD